MNMTMQQQAQMNITVNQQSMMLQSQNLDSNSEVYPEQQYQRSVSIRHQGDKRIQEHFSQGKG